MNRPILFVLCIAAFLSSLAAAQELRFAETLDGKKIPAVLKPKDLPSDYYAVKITTLGEFSLLDLYGPLAFSGGFNSGPDEERRRAKEALGQVASVYWTRGDKIKVDEQSFLVAYRLDIPAIAFANGNGLDTWAMENPLELTLQLIRPESIGRMSPIPSMAPDRVAKVVDAFTQSLLGDSALAQVGSPGSSRLSAQKAAALSNMKQVALSAMLYCSDYDDVFPYANSTSQAQSQLLPYLKNKSLFSSPNGGRILYNTSLSGVSAVSIPSPAEVVLFYEEQTWPDGTRAVGYCDGHAKMVDQATWAKISSTLKSKFPKVKPPAPPKPKPKPKKPHG